MPSDRLTEPPPRAATTAAPIPGRSISTNAQEITGVRRLTSKHQTMTLMIYLVRVSPLITEHWCQGPLVNRAM